MMEMSMELRCDQAGAPESEQDRYALLRQVISQYEAKESNLIQILHMGQAIFGCLPEDVQRFIGQEMDLPLPRVAGVVSFYSYFSTQPKGRHTIQVCLGTACYVRGGKKVMEALRDHLGIDVGETTADRRFSLEVKRCIGACGLAPAVAIDDVVYKRVDPNRLADILGRHA